LAAKNRVQLNRAKLPKRKIDNERVRFLNQLTLAERQLE
jgi:hypothetical protein